MDTATHAVRRAGVHCCTKTIDSGSAHRTAIDELWLLHGRYAKEARMEGLKYIPPEAILGRWMGGPTGWEWEEVIHVLAHH
jgi:hypothetical protein